MSLCNTASTYPGWIPGLRCCRIRRSKYDDDKFIDEILRDHEQHQVPATEQPTYDPAVGYHIKQPEPVARMDAQYPPTRPPNSQPQQSTDPNQKQPVAQEEVRRPAEERVRPQEGP